MTKSGRPRRYLGLDHYHPSQWLDTPLTFNRSDTGDEADNDGDNDDEDEDDDDDGEDDNGDDGDDDYDDKMIDDDTSYLQQVWCGWW